MQHNDTAVKFALLTRQELAYLSDGLPQLINTQKSKLNYKIKKKIEIFEKVELPLLMRSGFEVGSVSLSMENDEHCHSFDPGSKFGCKNRTNVPARALPIFTVRSRMGYPCYLSSHKPMNRPLSESEEKVTILSLWFLLLLL
ncbi:MAG TPA: hypothetical protein VFZ67_10025 [Nitrososphaera sp.]